MLRIRDVLERLKAETRLPLSRRMTAQMDPDVELGELERRLAIIKSTRQLGEASAPPKLDVDALWRRWERTRPSTEAFGRRELLALAWDSRAAADPAFIGALVAAGLVPARARFLRGLWHVHQQAWRLPTADHIEALIRGALGKSDTAPRWLRLIDEHPQIVSTKAPEALVAKIGTAWRHGLSSLEPVGILPNGNLGQLVLERATKAWLEAVAMGRDQPGVEEQIADGVSGLLPGESTSIERFRRCVEVLLKAVPGAPLQYKSAITKLILDDPRLGHPVRIGTRANWVGVGARERGIAVQLFAARDLQAFFEVLIGNVDDYQRRRAFWERYVESPQLVDFAIASDTYDKKRLLARLGKDRASVATLVGAPDEHSAFLMRFSGRQDIVVVEISQPNNAMYLFDTTVFERVVGDIDKHRFAFHELKSRTHALHWMSHVAGSWHDRFASVLNGLGIRPGAHR